MINDLGDPTTLALSSLALFLIALLLGLPAIRRVVAMRRFERFVGKLFWRIVTALDRHRKD